MFDTTLSIQSQDYAETVVIDPEGMTIGRHKGCDIVLADAAISRRHARLYRDPFGRWIIEDLDSHNGVWLGDRKVTAQAVPPGQHITIGPFELTIEDQQTIQAPSPASEFAAHATLIDDSLSGAELLSKAQRDETLSSDRLKQLNEMTEHLVSLSEAEQLHPWICRQMASGAEAVAMVLRLPAVGEPLPESPETLAFSAGGQTPDAAPHDLSMHVSRRVLEAVRTTSAAVMAGAARDDGEQMELTVVDARKPRAVLAAPMGEVAGGIEVLYLDIPAEQSSESLLDYVQAVARQANFARKGLLLAQARAERAILDRQLEFAREIQLRLTPPAHTKTDGIDVAVLYEPAMWVGGDYCDIWTLPDGRLAWAIGDVTGKGLPAALVMATLHGALRTMMNFCSNIAEAVNALNTHLVDHTPEEMFVTLIAGILDPGSGEIEFVNAGHLLPLLVAAGKPAEELGTPTNPPIGVLEIEFTADRHTLPAGTTILAVTDGITESANPDGDQFGDDRLIELATARSAEPIDDLIKSVAAGAKDFRKPLGPQDDTTVLAIARSGA
ncbi:hypothetical protein LCGC14_0315730 [marine sediment metagenome]|uniref:FHA domain-containing protein n=1 Tax=marine sediment metagenome TaxID=412755 RepID=A0A0F9U3C4_9ZZZZ